MGVLSNRQRRLARKANRDREAALPKPSPVLTAPVVQDDAGDVIGAAFLAEAAAAKAAVAEAQAALPQGETLPASVKRAIRSEYGVQRMSDPSAPAAYRLRSRDGLTSAFEARAITLIQHKAGLAYRLCFEAQASGLRSGLANAGMVGGGSSLPVGLGARDPAALRRAYLLARLRGMEAGLTERQLMVVRAVAGEGCTLRSLGDGGNTKRANLAALAEALEQIAGGLRIRAH